MLTSLVLLDSGLEICRIRSLRYAGQDPCMKAGVEADLEGRPGKVFIPEESCGRHGERDKNRISSVMS